MPHCFLRCAKVFDDLDHEQQKRNKSIGEGSEHRAGSAAGTAATFNTAKDNGYDISFDDLTASVRDKGWANLIDLGALTGSQSYQITMKPIRVDDLKPANTNG